MNNLFYYCLSLSSLPDISKWDTNNVMDISRMFYNCSALKFLPDISKWKIDKIIDMNGYFIIASY